MYKKTKFVLDDGTEFDTLEECQKSLDDKIDGFIKSLTYQIAKNSDVKEYYKIPSILRENLELVQKISELSLERQRGITNNEDS